MPQTDGSQGNVCVHSMLYLLYSCTLTQDSRLGRACCGMEVNTLATLSQRNFAISKWE